MTTIMFCERHMKLYDKTREYVSAGLRLGQSMFNSLWEIDPNLARDITGTDDDCFYNDNKICNFLKAISKEWNK